MKYILNPELILLHIMAFHAQAGEAKNNYEVEEKKLHTMEKRKKSCKWFITSFQTLVPQLIYLCCCY